LLVSRTMPATRIRSAAICLVVCVLASPVDAATQSIEAPVVTASIGRPVNSTSDLPSLGFIATTLVRDGRAVPYIAKVFAALDGGAFTLVATVQPEKGQGGRIDRMLSELAVRPGFHAVRVRVELKIGEPATSETYTLPPLFYAVYDPSSESSANVRALVYGPASTPAKEFDAQLGDEPLAAWLSGVVSPRRGPRDNPPEWWSDYCDNRTDDPTSQTSPTAICSVVAFQMQGEIDEIWFRTADIRETEDGIEWVPLAPAKYEGMTLNDVPESRRLSALPGLIDLPRESRPAGDISILPDDIVTATALPGAPLDVTVTVRNIGHQDLHKVLVGLAWGVDAASRPALRQVVVDVPQQGTAEIKLQLAFPNGYGFLMAHALSISEHSPFGTWTPDPTPDDDCAFRVINPQRAPQRYKETLLAASGPGCTAK